MIFDILRYNGEDLRGYPLHKRKELLSTLDFGTPHMTIIPSIETDGERLFSLIEALNMDGIVDKRANSITVKGILVGLLQMSAAGL